MKISALLSGTALTAVAAGAAFAADIPMRAAAPAPAPVFVAAPTWAGPYVGINLGVMHSNHDQLQQTEPDYYDYAFTCNDYAYCASKTAFGALAGVTAGYNFQSGRFVYGVEADIAGVFNNEANFGWEGNEPTSTKVNAIGTLRARAGVASASSLFYLTAGVAAVQSKLAWAGDDSDYVGSKSAWKWAPVVGAGIEHQLGGGWSAKIEGLYVFNVKSKLQTYNGDTGKSFRNDSDHAIVRLGLNYRFGGAPAAAPVLARY